MSANKDLKELQKSNSEMDVKAEMNYNYEDMYTQDYLEFLSNLCAKYNIDFNESEIDWEWCNYIHNKQWELEKAIKQSSNYKISNDEIIANMTADEKFKIICRIKDINTNEITESIIRKIQDSEIEDKDAYITQSEVWDDEYINVICTYDELFIDKSLLWSKEQAIDFFKDDIEDEEELKYLWIELNEKEKNFVQIALQCEVYTVKVEMM